VHKADALRRVAPAKLDNLQNTPIGVVNFGVGKFLPSPYPSEYAFRDPTFGVLGEVFEEMKVDRRNMKVVRHLKGMSQSAAKTSIKTCGFFGRGINDRRPERLCPPAAETIRDHSERRRRITWPPTPYW
jgi:hypothetical protein